MINEVASEAEAVRLLQRGGDGLHRLELLKVGSGGLLALGGHEDVGTLGRPRLLRDLSTLDGIGANLGARLAERGQGRGAVFVVGLNGLGELRGRRRVS